MQNEGGGEWGEYKLRIVEYEDKVEGRSLTSRVPVIVHQRSNLIYRAIELVVFVESITFS